MPLVNIAKGKPAVQSSLSPWSSPDDPSRAVSGTMPVNFAFCTDLQDRPWWQVDLLEVVPIDSIVIHNRLDMAAERAKTLIVEVSPDKEDWLIVHAGCVHFSGGGKGSPLVLPLENKISARYVRLSLAEREYFHLSQVEVFASAELCSLNRYRTRYDLANLKLDIEDSTKPWNTLAMSSPEDANSPVIGLKITYSGRLGNYLEQVTNAIVFAEQTDLHYVQVGQHELLRLEAPVSFGKLTILPPEAALPSGGIFVAGIFLSMEEFAPGVVPTEADHCRVIREFVRPYCMTGIPPADPGLGADELTIHIRAGDIFDGILVSGSWYRQPPLAFYQLVIADGMKRSGIDRVRLVYEDRGNPCVDALEDYLTTNDIPYHSRSGTLAEDLSALIDAPNLVFGFGTFGYAICKLSAKTRTLYYFAPELKEFIPVSGTYTAIPGIERIFSVHDRRGDYIKVGDWQNTPEQRQQMLDYPIEALELVEMPL